MTAAALDLQTALQLIAALEESNELLSTARRDMERRVAAMHAELDEMRRLLRGAEMREAACRQRLAALQRGVVA